MNKAGVKTTVQLFRHIEINSKPSFKNQLTKNEQFAMDTDYKATRIHGVLIL